MNTIEEIDDVSFDPRFTHRSGRRHPSIAIAQAYKTLQATFRAGTTRPLSWRKHQLNQIVLLLRENVEVIVQALATDLQKPRLEVLSGEIGPMVRRAVQTAAQLDEWASNESVQVPEWQQGWSPTVLKRPRGVVLIISCVVMVPFNLLSSSSPFLRSTIDPGITPFTSASSLSSAP